MATAATICSAAFAGSFRPEPDILVSEWADQFRIVGKPSPEPGPWRTDRVPYMREIMDCMSPSSPVQVAALMKAAQGAGSESALNMAGCWMHRYPDSMMIVQPTVGTGKKFVRTRLDRMIESTPVLRAIVEKAGSRKAANTMTMKEFQGNTLIITGANSANDLRSYPCRYGIGDEVDGWPMDLDGEGDPTELFYQRLAAYRNMKMFLLSTPTLEEVSHIWRWFQRGDQRSFMLPCPLCKREQALIWGADRAKEGRPGGLRWPKGEPDSAQYQCEHCGDSFPEWRKVEMLQRGEWVPQAPGVGRGLIRSYKVNALYYPYGWPGSAWPNLAAKWESDHRDPVKRKAFINLKLAEPYRDPSEAKADAGTLHARREAYGPELPAGVCILNAGGDVQADRIEAEKVGWGIGEESWSVEYRVFPGDTSRLDSQCWKDLDAWLQAEHLSELGISLSVSACCIDSRYNKHAVTQFCGERAGRRIWNINGTAGNHPIWSQKSRKGRGKYPPAHVVGVDAAKETLYARLRITEPGPGFCHFPVAPEYTHDFFEQLTSEIRVPDYSGPVPKFEWKKKRAGARNEVLDARVYAHAALVGLQMTRGLRLDAEMAALLKRANEMRKPLSERRAPGAVLSAARPIVSSDPYL